MYRDKEGIRLGYLELRFCRSYVPGGTAAYLIIDYETVPAIVAGGEETRLQFQQQTKLNPQRFAYCKMLGIKEIYKIGGTQAIAALALGTQQLNLLIKYLDLAMHL